MRAGRGEGCDAGAPPHEEGMLLGPLVDEDGGVLHECALGVGLAAAAAAAVAVTVEEEATRGSCSGSFGSGGLGSE
jgi:hypothetical protein